MTPRRAAIFKLLLLTAQRLGEVLTMRREDLDLATRWWTIPAERSKNGLTHRVPLGKQALAIVQTMLEDTSDSPWVFPSADGNGPVTTLQKAVRHIRRAAKLDFRPHDLRRTAASHMTGMGTNRLTVAKILNHAEHEVTAVYDRHSYDQEKRQALDAWGARIKEIVTDVQRPAKVVPLRRG